jgi:hypothetical protein
MYKKVLQCFGCWRRESRETGPGASEEIGKFLLNIEIKASEKYICGEAAVKLMESLSNFLICNVSSHNKII